jgi:hypothetical protein
MIDVLLFCLYGVLVVLARITCGEMRVGHIYKYRINKHYHTTLHTTARGLHYIESGLGSNLFLHQHVRNLELKSTL